MSQLCHLPCSAEFLGQPGDALIDQVPAQPPGDKVEGRARAFRTCGKGARQAFADLVEALRHGREDRLRLRPTANCQVETLSASVYASVEAMLRPVLKLRQLREKLGTDWHADLRGGS